jgi:transposase
MNISLLLKENWFGRAEARFLMLDLPSWLRASRSPLEDDGVDGTLHRCQCAKRVIVVKTDHQERPSMNEITTIGLDLAKSVFQVHGVDATGRAVLKRQLKRKDVLAFFKKLPPCLIGMEACATAHYWARELTALGHRVKLLPPNYVKAYVKRGKTDAADAEAICEAVTRPSLHAVPVKSVAQQSTLVLLNTRDLLVRQRTQTINALRGHMAEFGLVSRTGIEGVKALVAIVCDAADQRLTAIARLGLTSLATMLETLAEQIAGLDRAIHAAHRQHETSQRLATIPGVGPIIAMTVTATIGDAKQFTSGRAFAAWLGLTPRLDGTGGKVKLGAITKQGNRTLRRLLVSGATTVLRHAKNKPEQFPRLKAWLASLGDRLAFKKVAVALANKMARTIWALMVRGGIYLRIGSGPAAVNKKEEND